MICMHTLDLSARVRLVRCTPSHSHSHQLAVVLIIYIIMGVVFRLLLISVDQYPSHA